MTIMAKEQWQIQLNRVKSSLGLDNLNDRERYILAGGAAFVFCVLVYQLIISPYLVAEERLQKSLVRKEAELTEMKLLAAEYKGLQAEEGGVRKMLEKRAGGFTLFAFLDRQAASAGVKPKIKYMKPSVVEGGSGLDESIVEMRLEGVALDKLTEFIRLTESEENVVSIRRLSIQASSREEGFLDVILQIVTLMEAG